MSETETVTTTFYMASAGNCPSTTLDSRIVNPSFFYKKNVTQINKNFDGLEESYYLCSECENLSMFNSGWTGETVTDNYILGCFKTCKESNNTFSYLPKIETVDFEFTECVKAIENFRGCENIKDATVNYPKCVVLNGEFAGCKNLKSITIPSDLSSLVCGKQAFEGCENLTKFLTTVDENSTTDNTIKLPKLLCGVNMFKGCQLDQQTEEKILFSLPPIINKNGIKLNDFSLSDEEVNEQLKNWIDGYTVTRRKSKGVFQIKENENDESFHEISFSDFGIIGFDVPVGYPEQTMDRMAKGMTAKTKFTRSIDKAINRGWKIIYNGKTIEK